MEEEVISQNKKEKCAAVNTRSGLFVKPQENSDYLQ